jgi:hypothetical protein
VNTEHQLGTGGCRADAELVLGVPREASGGTCGRLLGGWQSIDRRSASAQPGGWAYDGRVEFLCVLLPATLLVAGLSYGLYLALRWWLRKSP